jgi:hypothetical protein
MRPPRIQQGAAAAIAAAALLLFAAAEVPAQSRPLSGGPVSRARILEPEIDPPWLGVTITTEGAQRGVRITEVIDGTPAEECGLVPGDEILQIDGTSVVETEQLIALVNGRAVGDRVAILFLRDAATRQTRARLAARIEDRNEILHRRLVGKPAPPLALWPVDGNDRRSVGELPLFGLDRYRGDVLVLLFWSTYCTECSPAQTALAALAAAEKEQGLAVVQIANEDRSLLLPYLQHAPQLLPTLQDASPTPGEDGAFRLYGVEARPTLVVIDHRGLVRYAALLGSTPDGVPQDPDGARLDDALFAIGRALRDRNGAGRPLAERKPTGG